MSKARLVITAVVVEKRSVREVADAYGVSRSWIYELLARYRAEGDAAFEPRSRRRHTNPGATAGPTDPEYRAVVGGAIADDQQRNGAAAVRAIDAGLLCRTLYLARRP